jgi:sugar lactone lactonase YvrE
VRKITVSTGIITTVVGTGSFGYSGDGQSPTSASLCNPHGLAFDSSGNYYIGDHGNHRVRKVTIATNIISTYAGTGSNSHSGDNGQATSAAMSYPQGVAVDASGNIYIGELSSHRIRKVTSTGVISTIAGTGTAGYSGDGGQATAANIKNPAGVNLDSAGNVYFGDCNDGRYNVVRKVTVSTGVISTVAGTGSGGYNGDNIQATAAMLHSPHGVTLDNYGNLYICDRFNYRIRKVDVLTGVITTVIGNGTRASTGDGAAASAATISLTCYSRFDSTGNYYISECGGNRVRKVITVTTYIPTATPTMIPR